MEIVSERLKMMNSFLSDAINRSREENEHPEKQYSPVESRKPTIKIVSIRI